ncbi:hypothetical protein HDU79_010881 [Rhizoclosmatium sp. JEL0117]|nr:hypothetical protein HDU79_010881 [Rhizoclosmatium sp. JEL0117]
MPLPEHIVFCLDRSIDSAMMLNHGKDQTETTRLSVAKMLIKRFMAVKSQVGSAKHQFALMTFVHETVWNCPITPEPELVAKSLDQINSTEEMVSWDADSLFDTLIEKAPDAENPEYVLRVILLYFRSTPPTFTAEKATEFCKRKACFIDTLYVHDKASDYKELVQSVYDRLHELSESSVEGSCYIQETSFYKKYVSLFARLLAHPLQRKVDGYLGLEPHGGKQDDDMDVIEAYDQHMNLVLSDVDEVITVVDVNEETFEERIRVSVHQVLEWTTD